MSTMNQEDISRWRLIFRAEVTLGGLHGDGATGPRIANRRTRLDMFTGYAAIGSRYAGRPRSPGTASVLEREIPQGVTPTPAPDIKLNKGSGPWYTAGGAAGRKPQETDTKQKPGW